MAAADHQAVILESIDSLRRRKARPDLERISHMVERKCGLTGVDVISGELERMVDSEIVIKVDYKGSTSYRNAANWRKSHLSGCQLNSNDATRSILAAIEKLTIGDTSGETSSQTHDAQETAVPSRHHEGASLDEIEKFFVDADPDTKFSRGYLEEALKREVGARRLFVSPSGNFVLAKYAVSPEQPQTAKVKRGRPQLKRKRIRKKHGPEWEQEPLTKISTWEQKCDYCTLPAGCNKFGDREELLVCKDCTLKAHPSCMKYSKELATRCRLMPWQCFDCKTCHVCKDAGDADTLLFCDSCDQGYHMACHTPNIIEKPVGTWVCELCANEDMEIGINFTDEDSLASSSASINSVKGTKEESLKAGQTSSGQVTPDVATANQSMLANLPVQSAVDRTSAGSKTRAHSKLHPATWSLAVVEKFFAERGFAEQAAIFKDQEIDGNALLLLRRSDVLTGLSFKLGPALKIYKLVSDLQLYHGKQSPVNGVKHSKKQHSPSSSKSSTVTSPPAPSTKSSSQAKSKASNSPTVPQKSPLPTNTSPPSKSTSTSSKKTSPKTSASTKTSTSAKTSPTAKSSSSSPIPPVLQTKSPSSPAKATRANAAASSGRVSPAAVNNTAQRTESPQRNKTPPIQPPPQAKS